MTRAVTRTASAPTVLIGLVAGFLSGLFGVGGGILVAPALVFILRMEPRRAYGTSLGAVLPISIASVVGYGSSGDVDWLVATYLTAGALAGAVAGTKLVHLLSPRVLSLAFSGLLVVTAVRLFMPLDAPGREAIGLAGAVGLIAVGLASGVLAGLLGVGGGIIMVPAMMLGWGIGPVVAKGTSVAVIVPTALMGTWRNRANDNVDLRRAITVGLAGVASAMVGTVVSRRLDDMVANTSFAVLLLSIAAKLLWEARLDAQR